ncbi:MAG TPA: T9SS type A sorting domain-containing protein [Flavobacteriales bacterium]|nr:T9SS type A sorting domain-containing protein [Flavobacteriales bacterium]
MKALTFLVALVITLTTSAQATSGPTSTGFGEGAWNAGQFEQRTTGRVVLFPNPANDQLAIAFPGFTGMAVVSIIGADGRVLEQQQVNQTAGQQFIADVAGLPNGYYLVNVEQDGDRVVERLVVAH